jgi:hypothetical protein
VSVEYLQEERQLVYAINQNCDFFKEGGEGTLERESVSRPGLDHADFSDTLVLALE